MVVFTTLYLIIGIIWTTWLALYTRSYLKIPNMAGIEAFINIIFWPLQLMTFVYYFFTNK